MSVNTKHLRPRDISKKVDILSPVDDLKPLPAPYDTNGLEPDWKPMKEEWAKEHCAIARRLHRS